MPGRHTQPNIQASPRSQVGSRGTGRSGDTTQYLTQSSSRNPLTLGAAQQQLKITCICAAAAAVCEPAML